MRLARASPRSASLAFSSITTLAARASDLRRGRAPGLAPELRVLAGCGWHTVRRACPQGIVM